MVYKSRPESGQPDSMTEADEAGEESLYAELAEMTATWADDWQQALGEHLGRQIAAEGHGLKIYRGADDDGG